MSWRVLALALPVMATSPAGGPDVCAVRYTEGTNALNLREVLATTVRDDVDADGDRRRTMRLGLLILSLGRRATSARRK